MFQEIALMRLVYLYFITPFSNFYMTKAVSRTPIEVSHEVGIIMDIYRKKG
jgi:hypothetical protein